MKPKKDRKAMQNWLNNELQRANMKQAQLADKVGIHKNLISRYCLGYNYPNIPHFVFMCSVLATAQNEDIDTVILRALRDIVKGDLWNV
tara:strand:+ start:216 stop:482 length:267 start_codon:yes stop_codon:yes gene_type:complete